MEYSFLLTILNVFFIHNHFNAMHNEAVENYYKNNFTVSKKIFEKIIETNDTNLKAKAYFYIGNIKFKEKKYLEAIAQYKNALRLEPEMEEAKYNLVFARSKLYENKQKQNDAKPNNETQQINEILNETKQLEKNAINNINAKNQNHNHNHNIKNW